MSWIILTRVSGMLDKPDLKIRCNVAQIDRYAGRPGEPNPDRPSSRARSWVTFVAGGDDDNTELVLETPEEIDQLIAEATARYESGRAFGLVCESFLPVGLSDLEESRDRTRDEPLHLLTPRVRGRSDGAGR